AEQRHQAVEADGRLGRLDRGVDRVRDLRPVGGQQVDVVRGPLYPWVGDADLAALETTQLRVAHREVGEDVVDDNMRDADRVGPVVAEGQIDPAGMNLGALDRELLDRRRVPVAETR